MAITAIKVTDENKAIALNLKMKEEQFGMCETVLECLLDAEKYFEYEPIILCEDSEPIGFCMFGFFAREGKLGRAWLDRIFIDARFQGRGLGKKSVIFMVNHIKNKFKVSEVYLSVFKENQAAINLYLSLGFKFNGEKDFNGEEVMVCSI